MQTILVGRVIDLLELLLLSACGRVDVMTQQLQSWMHGVHVALSISVEGWLAEVSGKGTIGQPSGRSVDFYRVLLASD